MNRSEPSGARLVECGGLTPLWIADSRFGATPCRISASTRNEHKRRRDDPKRSRASALQKPRIAWLRDLLSHHHCNGSRGSSARDGVFGEREIVRIGAIFAK